MVLAKVDGWLIDHVAEPVSERLRRFGTCFDLARLLGLGIYVLSAGALVMALGGKPLDVFLDVLDTSVPVFVTYQYLHIVHTVERLLSRGMANPIRHAPVMQFWRVAYSLFNLGLAAHWLSGRHSDRWSFLFGIATLLWAPLLYFSACTPRPPAPAAREPFPAAGVPQGA